MRSEKFNDLFQPRYVLQSLGELPMVTGQAGSRLGDIYVFFLCFVSVTLPPFGSAKRHLAFGGFIPE